jgi:pSer/pThr/pTyr-binding forkhead associated (FHA) protein
MPSQTPQAANEAMLLVLATDQKVHAYDLARFSRVGIGRHESNEIQLPSRAVSNFHAEILKEDGALVIRDLGSTNGTRVNGERIDRTRVSPGDSIRIGNHVLSLQLRPPSEGGPCGSSSVGVDGFGPGAHGRILAPKARPVDGDGATDLPLAELLRRISARPEPHRALLERDGRKAQLLFNQQRLFHVEYEGVVGEKALYRLFSWHEGSYEIQPLGNTTSQTVTICLPLDALVVEGMDHAQELGKLIAGLPPLASPLRLKEDCPLPLTAHSPAEIEIFQAIIRHETIEKVLERSPWTDVRVARLIASLLSKGVFEASSPGEMDETYNLISGLLRG